MNIEIKITIPGKAYPYIGYMKDFNEVVLWTDESDYGPQGTILFSEDPRHKVGEIGWAEECYIPFTGNITLSND